MSRDGEQKSFSFSDVQRSSSVFWKSCLFDQGSVVFFAFYRDFEKYMRLSFHCNSTGAQQRQAARYHRCMIM